MKIKILDRASMGTDIDFRPLEEIGEVEAFDFTPEHEVAARVNDADVIITNKVRITRGVMENTDTLKLICIFATGFDNVDVCFAKERGIAVCNVPAYSTESVTLYTVSMVLSLYTKMAEHKAHVECGAYTSGGAANILSPVYHEIAGKTWGIIGYGNIGRRVGEVASSLGAKVIFARKRRDDAPGCTDIDSLLRESDIVTVHCPLNDGTRGLISAERIAVMKENSVLVNVARGAVVDEAAVAEAVLSGKIGAFGADVYSVEPFSVEHPYSLIKALPNVILTPHCAWAAYEARKRCLDVIVDNIKAFIGGKIKNRVDIVGQN